MANNNVFTLDSIREAAEAKYKSLVVPFGDGDSATLRNVLRLSEDERKAFGKITERLDDPETSQFDTMAEAVCLIAEDRDAAARLIEAIGRDRLDVLAQLFETYSEGTQMGEASASQG